MNGYKIPKGLEGLTPSHHGAGSMNGYKTVKIPVFLADLIDELAKSGEYSSRAEYVKEVVRRDLRERGLLGGES